jgi:hypothetical protein
MQKSNNSILLFFASQSVIPDKNQVDFSSTLLLIECVDYNLFSGGFNSVLITILQDFNLIFFSDSSKLGKVRIEQVAT